jgi:UDP-glucose 4-epimerase
MLAAVQRVSGRSFNIEYGERRQGDSPALVADNALARRMIGWIPSHDLESIIRTAWNWHTKLTAELTPLSP